MPQLDFFSIANQFTWGIFYFGVFYFIINSFVVPTIFASLFAREFVIKNSSSDNFEGIYYSFTAFYVFNLVLAELSSVSSFAYEEVNAMNFNNFVIISKLIETELSSVEFTVFEDFDTN